MEQMFTANVIGLCVQLGLVSDSTSSFGSWDIMSASSSGVGVLYCVRVSSGPRAGIKAENDLETEPS